MSNDIGIRSLRNDIAIRRLTGVTGRIILRSNTGIIVKSLIIHSLSKEQLFANVRLLAVTENKYTWFRPKL